MAFIFPPTTCKHASRPGPLQYAAKVLTYSRELERPTQRQGRLAVDHGSRPRGRPLAAPVLPPPELMNPIGKLGCCCQCSSGWAGWVGWVDGRWPLAACRSRSLKPPPVGLGPPGRHDWMCWSWCDVCGMLDLGSHLNRICKAIARTRTLD